MIKNWHILILLALAFFSCEKEIEIEMEERGGRLVLYSFIAPDSILQVHLSKSVSHLSVDDFERVYNGNITVYRNDRIVDDFIFPFDESWANRYGVNFSSGDSILIEAFDGSGQSVSGKTIIPDTVPFLWADTATVVRSDNKDGERKVLNCKLTISDPAVIKNYYQLIIFEQICRMEEGVVKCEQKRVVYDKTDPVFFVQSKEGSLIGEIDFDGCFSDTLFNGENYNLEVDLPLEYATVPDQNGASRKIYFLLLSHTRGFYDYYRSRVVAEYGYDLPIIDPIRIYNNIDGGLGLVTGYNVTSDSLIFDNGI
ncbi:uncharacterized protein DUF4249 [Marinilabilia salmonicolor]|uniref:DUF4249 domain-containing protein n=1 Tax=Marinilabilia salmonicolor TaxID=989 RepID=UPI000D426EBC|nr:DUF4249 domain-containing protein [Marinilabilia salmonicolor]PRY91858.1 uncharacterized protein DUF4249 [Marinilabilia salmonicolor]